MKPGVAKAYITAGDREKSLLACSKSQSPHSCNGPLKAPAGLAQICLRRGGRVFKGEELSMKTITIVHRNLLMGSFRGTTQRIEDLTSFPLLKPNLINKKSETLYCLGNGMRLNQTRASTTQQTGLPLDRPLGKSRKGRKHGTFKFLGPIK